MTTALVLSGGAAQGSFEAGALDYFYQRGFFAKVICSTSVGSVNALMLAQGGNPPDQSKAFDALKSIWATQLFTREDMCDEAPWLAGASPRVRRAIVLAVNASSDDTTGNAWGRLVTQPTVNTVLPLGIAALLPPAALEQSLLLGIELVDDAQAFKELVQTWNALSRAQSLFTLAPTRSKVDHHLDVHAVATSGVDLRLVAVGLESGAVRYITESGALIETDGRPVLGSNACAAERRAYSDAHSTWLDLVSAAHEAAPKDRQAAMAAAAAAAQDDRRALAALQNCVSTAMAHAEPVVVDIADAAMASSAIPCVFPPVRLGDEAYVDGGIRWDFPLLAALDFDPDLIVGISTGTNGIANWGRESETANLLDIANRAVFGLELWETQERHIALAKIRAATGKQKVWLVFPRYIVHDGFTVDAGLIDINMAYGYMCAADVATEFPFPTLKPADPPDLRHGVGGFRHPDPVIDPGRDGALYVDSPTDPAKGALADAIAKCRVACWRLEHEVLGRKPRPIFPDPDGERTPPPNLGAVAALRTMKTMLGLLVDARQQINGPVPAGAAGWADSWERHRWPTDPATPSTPWGAFMLAGDVGVAADTRPTVLVAKAPDRPEVYLLNPFRHWITTPAALEPFGGWAVVREVPGELLDAIPAGENIV